MIWEMGNEVRHCLDLVIETYSLQPTDDNVSASVTCDS